MLRMRILLFCFAATLLLGGEGADVALTEGDVAQALAALPAGEAGAAQLGESRGLVTSSTPAWRKVKVVKFMRMLGKILPKSNAEMDVKLYNTLIRAVSKRSVTSTRLRRIIRRLRRKAAKAVSCGGGKAFAMKVKRKSHPALWIEGFGKNVNGESLKSYPRCGIEHLGITNAKGKPATGEEAMIAIEAALNCPLKDAGNSMFGVRRAQGTYNEKKAMFNAFEAIFKMLDMLAVNLRYCSLVFINTCSPLSIPLLPHSFFPPRTLQFRRKNLSDQQVLRQYLESPCLHHSRVDQGICWKLLRQAQRRQRHQM